MAANKKPTAVVANDPADLKGELKAIGGSRSDDWNNILANQAINTLWLKHSDDGARDRQCKAAVAALVGIGPKDELEGMIAAQLIACHNASMECYRRAMLPEQPFEGWREQLNQANKLSRTYATLLEALNRHRGKGQQKVTVEHVHVHAGGQAVVGVVEPQPEGAGRTKGQSHEKQIAHAPQPAMWSADKERDAVSIGGNANRPMPDARGQLTGCPEGE